MACSDWRRVRQHPHQHGHFRRPVDHRNSLSKHLKMNPSHFYPKLWSSSLNHQTLSRIMWTWAQVHSFFASGEVRERDSPHLPRHRLNVFPQQRRSSVRSAVQHDSAEQDFPSTWLHDHQNLLWRRIIAPGTQRNLTIINTIWLLLSSLRKQKERGCMSGACRLKKMGSI